MTMPPLRTVTDLLHLVEQALTQRAALARQPQALYEPTDYILALPAKRARPLLSLLAYQAIDPEADIYEALPLAVGLELFHNFTLVHDDIMDHAPTRRGQPTVHVRWDLNTAILSGDALFAESVAQVATSRPDRAGILVPCFVKAALEVCEGQMDDLLLAGAPNVGMDAYLEMIRKKTAVLIGASLALGALAADASPADADALARYGELVGTAFQIQDDYLDTYGDGSFGKQIGGDILENKRTFLYVYTRLQANPAQLAVLDAWEVRTDQPDEKIAAVRAIFDAVGAPQAAQGQARTLYAEADTLLEPLRHRCPGLQPLETFLQQLLGRTV